MKGLYISIIAVIFFGLLLFPLVAIKTSPRSFSPPQSDEIRGESTFLIKDAASGKTEKVPIEEYIVGVLAAEISPSYSPEAIKAQAVASYTYALRKQNERKKSGGEYDLTTDFKTDQAYLNSETRAQKWGAKAAENEKILKDAWGTIKNQYLSFQNEPILAVYHSISSGKTENSADVWGKEYRYLVQTQSIGDLLCPDYISEKKLSKEEFSKGLEVLGVSPEIMETEFLNEPSRTGGGMVLEYTFGDKKVSGKDIRAAFSLRSAAFDLEKAEDGFKFTVRGYGHLVGMSQYGANYMAMQGSDYEEILKWYYKDCEIIKP